MMNFKIFKITVIGILSIFIISACTDLEVINSDSIVSEVTDEGFVPGDPTQLLESSYSDLTAWIAQDPNYALNEHASDEMLPPTRGVDWGDNGIWRVTHAHTWDQTSTFVVGAWNSINQRAFKDNQVLASNPSAQEAAEARFLRAWYMWHIMDLYGQVPFREVDQGADVDPTVLTRAEAYAFIVTDLETALANLLDNGPAGPSNTKATLASAHAMLSRVKLNKGVYLAAAAEGPYTFDAADMTEVIEHADAVTASGYSLEPNYFDNFSTNASTELIWTTNKDSPQARWNMTLHYDMNPSGWNGFTTIAEFYDKFETSDQRIGFGPGTTGYVKNDADFGDNFDGIGHGFLIGQQYKDNGDILVDSRSQIPLSFTRDVPLSGAATGKGIRVIKYHPADAKDYILIRYGEVVLNKAEAIMRGGTSTETALQVVNDLRMARGASPLTSLTEADMLDERGRELYWEGYRRVDQVRFGTWNSTWSEKTVTDGYRALYPIPQLALDSNPNLVQNPGY